MKNDQLSKFFLIIPPGLEKLAFEELQEKTKLHDLNSIKVLEKIKGGTLIEARADEGCSLNRILKIPVRILLRIDSFTARDIPKLYNKCLKIKWNDFIYNSNLLIRPSASKSRLIHTDKIQNAVEDSIKEYFKGIEVKKKFQEAPYSNIKHTIYINVHKDICTLSIDTSGEPLYKRGHLKEKSTYTLRENFVSAIIQAIKPEVLAADSIHDPMCGSGTILSELKNFYEVNKRKYNFEFFTKPALKKLENKDGFKIKISGSDINDNLFKSAIDKGLDLKKEDIHNLNEKYDLILTHPPYGKNTKLKNNDYKALFTKLGELSESTYFIIDKDNFNTLKKDFSLKNVLEFNNQGIQSVLGKINN